MKTPISYYGGKQKHSNGQATQPHKTECLAWNYSLPGRQVEMF